MELIAKLKDFYNEHQMPINIVFLILILLIMYLIGRHSGKSSCPVTAEAKKTTTTAPS